MIKYQPFKLQNKRPSRTSGRLLGCFSSTAPYVAHKPTHDQFILTQCMLIV